MNASALIERDQFKPDPPAIKNLLPGIGEINRDAVADARLHLTFAPAGLVWIAHDHPRFQHLIHQQTS